MNDCGRKRVTAFLIACVAFWSLDLRCKPVLSQESDGARGLLAGVTESNEGMLQAKIASLIEQLGDANYHQRVNARWELERVGLAAFEQLQAASQSHPNADISRTARYLVESQNVVWWLETDALEVRELLKDYNESKEDAKETSLQQLAELGTPDALLALSRLVRFESSELRSKSAALHLMEAVCQRMRSDTDPTQQPMDPSLLPSLRLTLGDSQRTASQWLATFMQDMESAAAQTPHPNGSLEAWQLYVAREHARVAAPAQNVTEEFARRAANQVTSRLYRMLGCWVTRLYSREKALEVVRPSLALVGEDPRSLLSAAGWSLDSELPELVPELVEKYPKEFSEEPQLGYFLAESHLRLANDNAAEAAARAASLAVTARLEALKKDKPNLNFADIQATRHEQLARFLAQRGLFKWAEREFLNAISLESSRKDSILAQTAEFYWLGAEYEKAAALLKPLAEKIADDPDSELPNAPFALDNSTAVLANYYFYSGLAAINRNDKVEASDYLRKAMELESALPNPDVVIALKTLADEEPFRSYYQESFATMAGNLRVSVMEAERMLANATDRDSRAVAAPALATECNQLAWLLSKCQVNPQEALALSLRSLELAPDEPIYLDTLARCYFAAGQTEEAIRTQKHALKLAPHERQMAAQLSEFEEALAKSNNAVNGE